MTDNGIDVEPQAPPRVCSNCAYRMLCQKKYAVTFSNGEVVCNEYARDLTLKQD